jgi:hypothetical protein
MEGARVAWRIVGFILVCVHSEDAPTDVEYGAVLEVMRTLPHPERMSILIYTCGDAPNALQRAALNDVLAHMKLPVVIVAQSILGRGVGTALRWFNPQARVFDADDIEEALNHLQTPPGMRPLLLDTLAQLKRETSHSA